MEPWPLSFSLRLLNAMIGLCEGIRGMPRVLKDLGYKVRGIEARFLLANERWANPDLIVGSAQEGHTLLCEWKSGRNADLDQAERYARVTTRDLTEGAELPLRETRTHDCALFVQPEYGQDVDQALAQAGYSPPMIEADETEMVLTRRQLQPQRLDRAFRESVDISLCPRHFVPFDRESEDWQIAHHVLNIICLLMHKRVPEFTVDDVAERAFPPWGVIEREYRGQLRDNIRRVVNELSDRDMSGYFERKPKRVRSDPATWVIVSNPADVTYDRRTVQWRALYRACQGAVTNMRGTRPRLPLE